MKILNRPMFRYGGPIKEGIMDGIQEPRQGYKVGSKVSLSDQAKAFENIFTTPQTTGQQATQFATGYPRNVVRNISPVVKMSLKERIENAPEMSQVLDDVGMPMENIGKGYIGNEPGIDRTTKEFFKGTVTRGQSEGYKDALAEVEQYKNPNSLGTAAVTGGKSPFNYTVDEVIKEKDTVIDTEGNRKKSINNILEKLGYARSQKNALYDALIAGGQRISREGLGKTNLVNDLIADTSTAYDKPEKIRQAAELMQVQQDLKLEGIEASKTNKNEEDLAFWTKRLGSEKKALRFIMKEANSATEAYLTTKKATGSGLDGVKGGIEWLIGDKQIGENENRGEINSKKFDGLKDFLTDKEGFNQRGAGVYQLNGMVVRINENGTTEIIKSFGTIDEKTSSWWNK